MMHFFTESNQLSLRVTEAGKLQFCYLGPRLAVADDALLSPAAEWPLYATDFDSRGQWGNHSGEYALHLRYADGTLGCDLQLVNSEPTAGGGMRFTLADPRHPELEVQLLLTPYPEEDTLTLLPTLTNKGSGSITLLQADSAALPLRAAEYHQTTFRGGWSGENYMHQQRVERGSTVSVASTTGIKTAQEGTPGILLSLGGPAQETGRPCLLAALAWSGNYDIAAKHSPYGHLHLRILCELMLSETARACDNADDNSFATDDESGPVVVQRVGEWIREHYAEPISNERLVKLAGYGKSRFFTLFFAETGLTPHSFLLRVRLQNAKRMLRESRGTPVDKIAAAVGFDSPLTFASAFKRYFGVRPDAWRRRNPKS